MKKGTCKLIMYMQLFPRWCQVLELIVWFNFVRGKVLSAVLAVGEWSALSSQKVGDSQFIMTECVHACVTSHFLQTPGLQPAQLHCSWNFPVKHTGVDCHFLLQGIFLTQGSNPHLFHLLHWQAESLPTEQGFDLQINRYTRYLLYLDILDSI